MPDIPIVDLHRPYQKIAAFGVAIGADKGKVYRLLNARVLDGVKSGRNALIRQSPAEYLASLPAYQPGTMPPGPGRPKKSA